MRAMILAAGLGTRLLPLTNSRPKALVSLRGVTLLEFWIDRLSRGGCDEVFLNAFHFKDRIAGAVSARQWPIPVRVLNEPVLLGTGGGIRAAVEHFGDEPVAVINVDIVGNVDLTSLYERHRLSGAEVSLLLHDWPEFNNVAVNGDGRVLGFGRDAKAAQMKRQRRSPACVHRDSFHQSFGPGRYCLRGPGRYSQHLQGAYSQGRPSQGSFPAGSFLARSGIYRELQESYQ